MKSDTNKLKFADYWVWKDPHSPKKATLYSALVPGLGQLYNRKYWKAPIVWATMGTATWYLLDQRAEKRKYDAKIRYQLDTSNGKYFNPLDQRIRNQAQQQRDFAILALTALYALQIIDANVDAHFYKLDMNEKIGLYIKPSPVSFVSLQYKIQ